MRRISQGQWLAFFNKRPGLHSHPCSHSDSLTVSSSSDSLSPNLLLCSVFLLLFFFSDSLRSQNAELSGSVKALKCSQEELEKRLAAVQLQHQQENDKLQTQLEETDSRSKVLEREVLLCICNPFTPFSTLTQSAAVFFCLFFSKFKLDLSLL